MGRTVMAGWDRAYSTQDILWYPNEPLVRFTAKYLQKRIGFNRYIKRGSFKRVLDLGCGEGRHIIFFAQQGFDAYGIDVSHKAVAFAKKWLNKEGLNTNLLVGNFAQEKYFPDNFFDAVVAHGVLDHMLLKDAQCAVRQVYRILRRGGIFYFDVISLRDSGYGQGKKIGPWAYSVPDGDEKGLPQLFFTLNKAKALVSGFFKILDIMLYESVTLQGKGISALDKNLPYTRFSRYHIIAKK